ncbi:MAG TPA: hypothetical protein VF881_11545 [Polyangiaceae bacterium]
MAAHSVISRRFSSSPERRSLEAETGWCRTLMEFAEKYVAKDIVEMGGAELEELLFRVFPREVICEPSDAKSIVLELRAFFTFLKRAYHSPRASACLSILNGGAARKLERLLGDPANFGIAKLFLMDHGTIAPFVRPKSAVV